MKLHSVKRKGESGFADCESGFRDRVIREAAKEEDYLL
jgi:hypothetical protein